MNQPGLVVASHGRHCWVEDDQGNRRICHHRGKKNSAVVGDRVQWRPSQDEGTIESIEPRRNLLYRQDELRTKSFAANLDQVLVLVAAEPDFSQDQLARALIASHAQGITPMLVVNKSDLGPAFALAWQRMEPYRQMGEKTLALSLKSGTGLDELLAQLQGKTTLILGPSGAGKSTLLRILGGIDLPDSGTIQTDSTISWPVGLVGGFQGSLTGRENVTFVSRIYAEKRKVPEKVRYVEEFAELGAYFDRPFKTYSSGMRSRVTFGLSMAFDFDGAIVQSIASLVHFA
jgi:hypothetical protein